MRRVAPLPWRASRAAQHGQVGLAAAPSAPRCLLPLPAHARGAAFVPGSSPLDAQPPGAAPVRRQLARAAPPPGSAWNPPPRTPRRGLDALPSASANSSSSSSIDSISSPPAASGQSPALQEQQQQQATVAEVVEALRVMHGTADLEPGVEAVVSGRGRHLGVAVSWRLRWTAGGAFTEEVTGAQLGFKWGHDGGADSACWEVDSSGLVRLLECDDHEAVLLTALLRTGAWLHPRVTERLDLQLLPPPPPTAVPRSPPPSGAASTSSDVGASTGASADGSGDESDGAPPPGTSRGGRGSGGAKRAGRRGGRDSRGSEEAADDVLALGVRLRGRRLRVRVFVRRRGWRVLGFDHRMCSDTETWELGEWREWAPGVRFPTSALHRAANGGQHAYMTASGVLERPSASAAAALPAAAAGAALLGGARHDGSGSGAGSGGGGGSRSAQQLQQQEGQQQQQLLVLPTDFSMPLLPPIPPDTTYAFPPLYQPSSPAGATAGGGAVAGCNYSVVPLWRASSGHYLVRPTVNGQEGGGYFVLDTGASGFVLTPQAAARLGGAAFGETHAASISGKVATRFVRLGEWCLGGLCVRSPVLMVMALEGLVRGSPGEVVGIVGHDLLRRAVVEVPQCVGTGASFIAAPASAPRSPSASLDSGDDWPSSDDEALLAAASLPVASTAGGAVTAARSGEGAGVARVAATAGVAAAPPPAAVAAAPRAASPALAAAAQSALGSRASGGGGVGPRPPQPQSTPVFEGSADRRRDVSAGGGGDSNASVGLSSDPQDHNTSSSSSSKLSTAYSSAPSSSSSNSPSSSSSSGNSSAGGGERAVAAAPAPATQAAGGARGDGSASTSSSGAPPVRRTGSRNMSARAARRAALRVPYTMHELRLHHPLEYGNEGGWVWHPLIMIANLPHVELRFGDPYGAVRSALLMVDSGACGADIMLHARAQAELGMRRDQQDAAAAAAAQRGGGDGSGGGGGSSSGAVAASASSATGARDQGHYLRGVGQDPSDFVQLQVLDLPWLEVAGVRFEQVRCMCAAVGGLDLSLYSHGILCGDLLARVEWAMDYANRRMGFRPRARAPVPARQEAAR